MTVEFKDLTLREGSQVPGLDISTEVGERAGNAPLEEVAVLANERGDDVALRLDELVPSARAVLDALDVEYDAKAVLGDAVYRHESGLHTAAMLRDPATYEPFDPARYGASRELLFGRGTGRGAVRALLERAGLDPTDAAVAAGREALRAAAEERGEPLARDAAERVVAAAACE